REELGTLGDRVADQYAPGAPALSGEALRARVLLAHEIFGAGDKVLPRVEFRHLLSRGMPLASVFASTTHMRECDDPTPFQPGDRGGIEGGIERETISAVTEQQCRVSPVALESAPIDDRERNEGAIMAARSDPDRFEASHVERAARLQRCLHHRVTLWIEDEI